MLAQGHSFFKGVGNNLVGQQATFRPYKFYKIGHGISAVFLVNTVLHFFSLRFVLPLAQDTHTAPHRATQPEIIQF